MSDKIYYLRDILYDDNSYFFNLWLGKWNGQRGLVKNNDYWLLPFATQISTDIDGYVALDTWDNILSLLSLSNSIIRTRPIDSPPIHVRAGFQKEVLAPSVTRYIIPTIWTWGTFQHSFLLSFNMGARAYFPDIMPPWGLIGAYMAFISFVFHKGLEAAVETELPEIFLLSSLNKIAMLSPVWSQIWMPMRPSIIVNYDDIH